MNVKANVLFMSNCVKAIQMYFTDCMYSCNPYISNVIKFIFGSVSAFKGIHNTFIWDLNIVMSHSFE